MKPPKIAAFYTNENYAREAAKLRASLEELCLDHYIAEYLGAANWTWAQAVCYKPAFILKCLSDFPTHDILYTDADSIARRVPPWGELKDAEIGIHFIQRTKRHGLEPLTGTLFFRNTPDVKGWVAEWAQITPTLSYMDTPEGHAVRMLMEQRAAAPPVKIAALKPEWCFIFDDMRAMHREASPIFEHYQKSREYRTPKAKG